MRSPRAVTDGNGFVFVDHVGNICPSGFLPMRAGNVRDDDLVTVYREHPLFLGLRDPQRLGALFFRGQRSQGAGVGLCLIRMLMQRMGGWAEFDSRPGAGFETRLHFRRAEESS